MTERDALEEREVLVQLGIDMSGIATESTLQAGVTAALQRNRS